MLEWKRNKNFVILRIIVIIILLFIMELLPNLNDTNEPISCLYHEFHVQHISCTINRKKDW